MEKPCFRGGGGGEGVACEYPVELSMCDCPIETFEYIWSTFGGCLIAFYQKTAEIHFIWQMVNCILPKNCRNTLPLHTVDQLASNVKNERLLWLAGMKCVKIEPITRLNI